MIPFKHLLVTLLVCSSVAGNAQFRLYEKGHDSYKEGKYEQAITNLTEYLTKGMRDKAIDIDVFYIRALAHYKLNHFQEAIPDFEETVLRGHTNKGNIYWFMAKCYDKLSNNAEAINYYGSAIRELKDKPDSKSKLLLERSELYAKAGDLNLSYQDLKDSYASQSSPEVQKRIEKLEKELNTQTAAGSRQADVHVKNSQPTNEVKTKNPEKGEQKAPAKEEPKTSLPSKDQPAGVTVGKKEEQKPEQKTELHREVEKPVQPEVKLVKNEEKPAEVVPALSPLQEMYKDEKRFALVIGNSAYPKQIGELKNPLNDATDIAEELKASNFQVTLLTNATYGQIRAALMKFKEKLDAGDPEKTVGLFYYAGHGLQFDDENYLVPLDAMVEYEDDIPRYCFPINRMVLSNMERSNTRMNIVILDACRNNPFPSLNRSVGNSGLGEMKRARGSFIAYATSPGSIASDGTGKNGLYTQELLKAMKKPGLTIEQVFKEVRANVLKLSGNKQNTWDSSNIVGEFHFKY